MTLSKEWKSALKKAWNYKAIRYTIEATLLPSVYRISSALWHVRPDFIRSASEFAKKGHKYEITDLGLFQTAAYNSAGVSFDESSLLDFQFKRHSHPAFIVDGKEDRVIETSWKGKLPLKEIGLRRVTTQRTEPIDNTIYCP